MVAAYQVILIHITDIELHENWHPKMCFDTSVYVRSLSYRVRRMTPQQAKGHEVVSPVLRPLPRSRSGTGRVAETVAI